MFIREKTRSDAFACLPLRSGFLSLLNAGQAEIGWLDVQNFLCRPQEPESHDEV